MLRKQLLSAVLIFLPWTAVGQTPQWKVVHVVTLSQQSDNTPPTTIFTPTTSGVYRMGEYISVVGTVAPNNPWTLKVTWEDSTGVPSSLSAVANILSIYGANWDQQGVHIFSPKAGLPVSYSVSNPSNPSGLLYNIVIVIEQLE
jgi:hypothetical protein